MVSLIRPRGGLNEVYFSLCAATAFLYGLKSKLIHITEPTQLKYVLRDIAHFRHFEDAANYVTRSVAESIKSIRFALHKFATYQQLWGGSSASMGEALLSTVVVVHRAQTLVICSPTSSVPPESQERRLLQNTEMLARNDTRQNTTKIRVVLKSAPFAQRAMQFGDTVSTLISTGKPGLNSV